MTEFDEDRLPALRRLHSLLVNEPTSTINAKQIDRYLTDDEQRQWRSQLAEYKAIKRKGAEAQLTGEAADYWSTLRNLYARAGMKKTPAQKKAFDIAVEELLEQFENLSDADTSQLRAVNSDDKRWRNLPHVLEEEFHIIRDGSHFQPWWDNPTNFAQRELTAAAINRLDPPPVQTAQTLTSLQQLRDLAKRLNR